jgi:hypothetical protein
MAFCIPETAITVSLILPRNMLPVLDGDVGVLVGDLGGGISGFEARSSASLNTADILGDMPKLT